VECPQTKKEYRWNIFLLRATPTAPIGSVEAPDAESAIKKAIEVFEITDPENQERLVAQITVRLIEVPRCLPRW